MEIKNRKVDEFLAKAKNWQTEMGKLRSIVMECGVDEELKWGKPCYCMDSKNIAIIQNFKDYCALLFPKGVLMKDPGNRFIAMTENTNIARQLRFTSSEEIEQLAPVIKAYMQEAVEVKKSGVKVPKKETSEFPVPEELTRRFEKDSRLKEAFEALTPGRQRGYLLYFAGAKQAATRESRIDTYESKILEGLGLND